MQLKNLWVRSLILSMVLMMSSSFHAAVLSVPINASSDDASEDVGNNGMNLNNNKLEFGDVGKDHIGLRFNNITIPSGAIINSASILFYASDNDDKTPSTVTIYGHDTDNAPTFVDVDSNITSRTQTSASTSWSVPEWIKDTSGAAQTTPDLTAIVQEIIDRGGWSSSNSMAFIFITTGDEQRRAITADDGGDPAPILTIDYTLPNEAELGITKTDSIGLVANGAPFSYILNVSNNGPNTAATVNVTDTLPAGVTYVSSFPSQGSCNHSAGVVTCNLGSMAVNAGAMIDILVLAPTFNGPITNTASVSNPSQPDGTPGNDSAAVTTTITGNVPQLCYMVADGGDLLTSIDTSDFNPTTNETTIGTTSGATNIEAIAWNSSNMTLYAANAGQLGTLNLSNGNFTALPQTFGTGTGSVGSVTFSDVDGLAYDRTTGILYGSHARAGSDVLIQIDMMTGAHVAGAFNGGADDYVVINSALTIVDDIAIDDLGDLYAVTNGGGVTDRLVRVNKATGATTDIGVLSVPDIEGFGTDTLGNLWGTSGTQDEVYEIDKNTGVGSVGRPIDNGSDYESIDCYATSPSFNVDIAVTKSVDNSTPNEGELVTFTIGTSNTGPGTASSLTISDTLPAGLTFDSATPSQGNYDDSTGEWYVGTLNNGSSATLTITATVNAGTTGSTITNTASLATVSQIDGNTANNEASVDVMPTLTVDLAITKTETPASTTFTPGSTSTYVIRVTNIDGPNDLVGGVMFDDLPNGVSLNTSWSCVAVGNASCVTGQPSGTGIAANTTDPINQAIDIAAGAGNYVEFTVPVQFSSNMADY